MILHCSPVVQTPTKRSKSADGGARRRKPRASGADSLQALAESVNNFADSFAATEVPTLETTPQRRRMAADKLKKEDGLLRNTRVKAYSLFTKSKAALDTYLSIDDNEDRVQWLQEEIDGT